MPVGDLVPYAGNAKEHPDGQVDEIAASIAEFGNCDPIGVWHDADGRAQIVEGHGRVLALRKLGIGTAPVIFLDHLTDEQRRAYAHVHNQTTLSSGFDVEALCADMAGLDFDWESLGFCGYSEGMTAEQLAESMASDEAAGYREFVDKFKQKKTTDDCYTPPGIYEVVLEYVTERYGIDPERVMRPFRPGGDYRSEDYPDGCCVVDNPPFSILSEIITFYVGRGVPFFLFCPTLTALSGGKHRMEVDHVICRAQVTYENGAEVCTSFVTNMGDEGIVLETEPELTRAINERDRELRVESSKQQAKYSFPDAVLTAAAAGELAHHGERLVVRRDECAYIRTLDSMEAAGKSGIYGGGILLSERAAAERAAAERWELSERELELQRSLGRG